MFLKNQGKMFLKNQGLDFSHVQMLNHSASGMNQTCHTNLIQILITRVWQKGKGKKDKYAGNTGTVRLFCAENHHEVVLI